MADALTEALTRDLPPAQQRLAEQLWRGAMATDTVLHEIGAMRQAAGHAVPAFGVGEGHSR